MGTRFARRKLLICCPVWCGMREGIAVCPGSGQGAMHAGGGGWARADRAFSTTVANAALLAAAVCGLPGRQVGRGRRLPTARSRSRGLKVPGTAEGVLGRAWPPRAAHSRRRFDDRSSIFPGSRPGRKRNRDAAARFRTASCGPPWTGRAAGTIGQPPGGGFLAFHRRKLRGDERHASHRAGRAGGEAGLHRRRPPPRGVG